MTSFAHFLHRTTWQHHATCTPLVSTSVRTTKAFLSQRKITLVTATGKKTSLQPGAGCCAPPLRQSLSCAPSLFPSRGRSQRTHLQSRLLRTLLATSAESASPTQTAAFPPRAVHRSNVNFNAQGEWWSARLQRHLLLLHCHQSLRHHSRPAVLMRG